MVAQKLSVRESSW